MTQRELVFAGTIFRSRIVANARINVGDTIVDVTTLVRVRAREERGIVATDDFIYGELRALN